MRKQLWVCLCIFIFQVTWGYAQSDSTLQLLDTSSLAFDTTALPLKVSSLLGTWQSTTQAADSLVISEVYGQLLIISFVENYSGYFLFMVQNGLASPSGLFESWGVGSCRMALSNKYLKVDFSNFNQNNYSKTLPVFTFTKLK